MRARILNTGLRHPLAWYIQHYGLPEQTVVNAYRRGWPLDDATALLERLIHAPGPKTKGLGTLMEFAKHGQRPSPVKRGSSRIHSVDESDSDHGTRSTDDSANIRVQVTIGGVILWQLITADEVARLFKLNERPWLNNTAD